jgi:hypothetical protein
VSAPELIGYLAAALTTCLVLFPWARPARRTTIRLNRTDNYVTAQMRAAGWL